MSNDRVTLPLLLDQNSGRIAREVLSLGVDIKTPPPLFAELETVVSDVETKAERRKRLKDASNARYRASGKQAISMAKFNASPKGKTSRKREWAKRRAFLNQIKNVPCADCHVVYDPCCMDFDHRPGAVKAFAIGTTIKARMESLLAEIAKCDIVCANCHRIRTHRLRDHGATTGRRKAK